MAGRSRKTPPRYTNTSGFTITPGRAKQLQAAIRNYNRRLQAELNRLGSDFESALPPRARYTDIRERVTSIRDINAWIRRLGAYRGSTGGFELTTLGGRLMTAAQAAEIEEAAKAENRRRRRALRQAQRTMEERGRFRTNVPEEARQITPEQIARLPPEQQERYTRPLYESAYVDPRLIQWQRYYLDVLASSRLEAYQKGLLFEDGEEAIRRIEQIVSNMHPEVYRQAQLANEELSIQNLYVSSDFDIKIQRIAEVWARYA